MIVIGDSLIKGLPKNDKYTVNCYPGIMLRQYIETYDYLQEDEDIIIYCLGINDYNSGETKKEIIENYNKLKRGTNKTVFIIPHCFDFDFYDECSENLGDDSFFITTFIEEYETEDFLHPNCSIVTVLHENILSLI